MQLTTKRVCWTGWKELLSIPLIAGFMASLFTLFYLASTFWAWCLHRNPETFGMGMGILVIVSAIVIWNLFFEAARACTRRMELGRLAVFIEKAVPGLPLRVDSEYGIGEDQGGYEVPVFLNGTIYFERGIYVTESVAGFQAVQKRCKAINPALEIEKIPAEAIGGMSAAMIEIKSIWAQ